MKLYSFFKYLPGEHFCDSPGLQEQTRGATGKEGKSKRTNQQKAKPTSRLLLVSQLLVLLEKPKLLCKRIQRNVLFLDSEAVL